jgi:hypothetical protein
LRLTQVEYQMNEYRIEFKCGESVEFLSKYFSPLGLQELSRLEGNKNAPLVVRAEVSNVRIDGKHQKGAGRIETDLMFKEPPTILALVPGGWLPIQLINPRYFLLDRNFISNLKKVRTGRSFGTARAFRWALEFVDSDQTLFNPLPAARESTYRRIPCFEEFKRSYQEAVLELRHAYPSSKVVQHSEEGFSTLYKEFRRYDVTLRDEIKWLRSIQPLIIHPVSLNERHHTRDKILEDADRLKISRQSSIVVLAMACVYEDQHDNSRSIGRKILSLKTSYSEELAYSALMDLRHLELLTECHVRAPKTPFAFCTSDRALARLWCTLIPRGRENLEGGIDVEVDLSTELFPGLDEKGLLELSEALKDVKT